MNLICLVIDRWHVGYVGCYGNSWVGTPQLDRLASESFCCDQAVIDHPDLASLYRSFWRGRHALAPHGPAGQPTLMRAAAEAGTSSTLLTDEPAVGEHPLAADFSQRMLLELPAADRPASDLSETHFGRFFAAASEWLSAPREPFLLWLHTAGLGAVWDAPLELRNQYVDEHEPLPPDTADVPCRELPINFDPDELLGIRSAYAGQVALLDTCIGALIAALNESTLGERTILAVLSARGFPLGEHQLLGSYRDSLHAELVHVPWLLRFPGGLGAAARTQSLVQPPDLMPTLLEACGIAPSSGVRGKSLMPLVRDEVDRLRDRAVIVSDSGERAIHTPAWYLRLHGPKGYASISLAELFVKPDDRWEINELSGRCPDVVDGLRQVLVESERAQQAGTTEEPGPLDDALLNGMA